MAKILGHCQCCARQQAVVNGRMAKHGYRVQDGWFVGTCAGHLHAPLEVDRSVTDAVVASIHEAIQQLEATLAGWEAGVSHPEQVKRIGCRRDQDPMMSWEEASPLQRREGLAIAAQQLRGRIRSGQDMARALTRAAEQHHIPK